LSDVIAFFSTVCRRDGDKMLLHDRSYRSSQFHGWILCSIFLACFIWQEHCWKNITGYQLLLFLLAGDFTQFTSDAAVLVSSFQLQLVISAATVTVKWFTQQGSRLRCVSDTLPGQLW